MIISHIQGGLGNQMFQYAAGRSLALRLQTELKLDLHWFSSQSEGSTERSFMLSAFPNIRTPEATQHEVDSLTYSARSFFDRLLRRSRQFGRSYIVEPCFAYWNSFEKIIAPAYLLGYWQNELYFLNNAHTIRRDFTFPPLQNKEAQETAYQIQSSRHAVAVHVRRGDYASNPSIRQYHGLCPSEYYRKALELVIAKASLDCELFIFSDDPTWVREHFDTCGLSASVLDFPEHTSAPWHDMHLMALCRHHIIANSSFSWWGAWLTMRDGVVCAPRQWFADKSKVAESPVPDKWIRI